MAKIGTREKSPDNRGSTVYAIGKLMSRGTGYSSLCIYGINMHEVSQTAKTDSTRNFMRKSLLFLRFMLCSTDTISNDHKVLCSPRCHTPVKTNKQTNKQLNKQANKHTNKPTNNQPNKQPNKPTNNQTNKQTNKQPTNQTNNQTKKDEN